MEHLTCSAQNQSGAQHALRVRWLGRVPYPEAHVLQRALHSRGSEQYLLLLEHPHVFTLGVHADPSHVLVDPTRFGASAVRTDRGGDVTYHGPGQLVAYPIIDVPVRPSAVPCYVHSVEQVVIDTLADFGIEAGRLEGYPGVWIDPEGDKPRKICAIGVRVSRARSMHGLALNVSPGLEWFDRIVPCGIVDKAVTSMAAEGVEATVQEVADALVSHAAGQWAPAGLIERQEVVSFGAAPWGTDGAVDSVAPGVTLPGGVARGETPRAGASPGGASPGGASPGGASRGESRAIVRLRRAGVDPDEALPVSARKPPWLRVPARMGEDFLGLKRTMRELDLVTVCEEAGCPNIFECWGQGTATFMINGERCTRACGFCLVDTRHPLPLDAGEPRHVADAVERLRLEHAVVTAVARDDLDDGGAAAFVATIEAIRERCPTTTVEVLVPDFKGDEAAISMVCDAAPDVFNHNLETVARLQRAVRPSAGYARSLAVLARAKEAGLVAKSGLILGMGETENEVLGALVDLRSAGVDIVTLGQYLRPSAVHLPVVRWWTPQEFSRLADVGESLGFSHVQSSPLTRSSYHARDAAASTQRAGSLAGSRG